MSRKFKNWLIITTFSFLFVFACISCKKSSNVDPNAGLPVLETAGIGEITRYTATCGGLIGADGGATITSRGVCWSTGITPTVNNPRTTDGAGAGYFISHITGLNPQTVYYVRAYATNSNGTAYGSAMCFTTLSGPSVSTNNITDISVYTAVCGGNVTTGGTTGVIDRGICYSTDPNPDTSDYSESSGSGLGSYSIMLWGLDPGTSYHIRAYANNGTCIGYGQDRTFTTNSFGTLTIDGHVYRTIQIGTQVWTADNLIVTRYRNGNSIATTSNSWSGVTTGLYIASSYAISDPRWGYHYNWYAVTDTRQIAPPGWHVSTALDWQTLYSFLGGRVEASYKLIENGGYFWEYGYGANNSSGFSAVGSGWYSGLDYHNFKKFAGFWTPVEANASNAYICDMFGSGLVTIHSEKKDNGYSIRLVKD